MKYIFIIILLFLFNHKALSDSLDYNLLIANPRMLDSRFKESVVILFYHNKFGASGLVINKLEKKLTVLELFDAVKLPIPKGFVDKELNIFWGGPINAHHLFFIHSSDYKSKNSIIHNNNFIITRSAEVLYDIAKNKGPKKFIIVKGFAIWSPGQLDEELNRDTWGKKTNYYLNIFNNDKDMWKILINSQGA